jgi:hypothetical protein
MFEVHLEPRFGELDVGAIDVQKIEKLNITVSLA